MSTSKQSVTPHFVVTIPISAAYMSNWLENEANFSVLPETIYIRCNLEVMQSTRQVLYCVLR